MQTNRGISEFTERWVKITQSRKKREKETRTEPHIMNRTNICTTGIPKKEKKNKIVKEIMAKISPKFTEPTHPERSTNPKPDTQRNSQAETC